MMMETFGIQLDDDSLLSLYYAYDPTGSGTLEYERLMTALLDPDYLALYSGHQDTTQASVDRQMHLKVSAGNGGLPLAMLATVYGSPRNY